MEGRAIIHCSLSPPSPCRNPSSLSTHAPSRSLYTVAAAAAGGKPSINLKEKVPFEDHLQVLDTFENVPHSSAGETPASLKAVPAATAVELYDDTDCTVVDIGQRMLKAERFGMPVKLSDEEKRSYGAESLVPPSLWPSFPSILVISPCLSMDWSGSRFGTATGPSKSDVLGKSEEPKTKARAERFGTPVPSMPLDEEGKKKARSARFSASLATDPQEEDKRKLRAIRFSDIPKAATAGMASGVAQDSIPDTSFFVRLYCFHRSIRFVLQEEEKVLHAF